MRHTLRRLPLLLAAILGVGASVGGTAATGAAIGRAASSVTKAQALTFANDVNLVAADVPGATTLSAAGEEGSRPSDAVFARCSGGVDPSVAVLDRKSAKFKLAGSELGSSAVVYPTSALAAKNFAATRSNRGQACLRRLLTEDLNKEASNGARYSATTLTALPIALPGGQQGFGFRVAVTILVGTHKLRSFIDADDVLVGPAEVNLTTTRVAQPPPAASERRLLALLAARAKYHEL
jgi:hypothetical protein